MNDSLYKEFILDLYRHPWHNKKLDQHTHHAEANNASCGDQFQVELLIDDAGIVQDIGFQGTGCAIATAAISLLADHVIGKQKDEVIFYTLSDIEDLLGVSIDYTREKCATIGLSAMQQALK